MHEFPGDLSWPRLSVVIPAYNEAAELPRCLRSLAAQDYPGELEVVVVDNASEDATAELARAAGARVVEEPVRGVCHARQTGTAAATGDVVVSTDADTTFPDGWLIRIAASLLARPDAVASCGPCRFEDGPWWSRVYTGTIFGVTAFVHRCSGRVLYASATNLAFRKSAWSGYDLRLTQGGDELGLLRSLRTRGAIVFDRDRVTSTSSRRLARGLVYNLLVTCLFFYLGAYGLNRLLGRQVLGNAPAVRVDAARPARRAHLVAVSAVGAVLAIAWWLSPVDVV